ncbi:MAG: hypothetical protein J0L92_40790 [Deltaproteobacteria bacterium]|nr:hypothetical protein [Deltaproteobacteria bacterium]
MTPELEALFVEQIRAAKGSWRNGGLTMIALMGLLAMISYFGLGGREGTNLVALCGLGGIVGVLLLIPSLGNPENAKILGRLRNEAQRIVWLYVFTQTGRGVGSWILIGFEDGKRDRLPAIRGREDEVLRAVASLAPQATVGFTPAIETQFKKSPIELRRAR